MRRLTSFLLGAGVLAAGCDARERREGVALTDWDTASLVISAVVPSAIDTVPLFNPLVPQWIGDRIVVPEPGDGRITLFDSLFSTSRHIGREGEGPGEYRQPMTAGGVWPYLAIADFRTRRATVVNVESDEVVEERSLEPAALGGGVAAGPNGRLFHLGSRGTDSLIVLTTGPDSIEVFASGPTDAGPADTPLRFDHLISSSRGPIVVHPDGELSWFSWSGEIWARLPLAGPLFAEADAVVEAARELMREEGQPFLGAPRVRAVSARPDGRVVGLLVGRPERILGFTADPQGRQVRFLRLEESLAEAERDLLLSAQGAIVVGSRLVITHPGGLAEFELSTEGGG